MEETSKNNETAQLGIGDVSTSTVIYTEQDMIDCFTAGVKFARNMMGNPSNTEYMMLVKEQKLSAK